MINLDFYEGFWEKFWGGFLRKLKCEFVEFCVCGKVMSFVLCGFEVVAKRRTFSYIICIPTFKRSVTLLLI